ncbi:hypothetical protein [Brevibacillus brevis]|uniref:hypothetical protein n=1 Tax=Brevibacillus brevis TaxID=1393 RepID=UPI000D10F3F3|nr:hypothetical protein [Brevibacillus brevis]PSJ66324.1 hypothetical protein C7J99_26675 [Brevibacillus brevis]RED21839.1 hypothetical protein DES34_118104 [Brevibacillus brevis]GEC93080.1 hypothetical protein BBR01nite_54110 [Brevibacillus brevis]VEF92702.1 Uncharacterised protein [Brevibacillus brevis]
MPHITYSHAQTTNSEIDALERFEQFLDDSHEEIAQYIHHKLVDFHSEIDNEVNEILSEKQQVIDELREQIEELQRQLDEHQ